MCSMYYSIEIPSFTTLQWTGIKHGACRILSRRLESFYCLFIVMNPLQVFHSYLNFNKKVSFLSKLYIVVDTNLSIKINKIKHSAITQNSVCQCDHSVSFANLPLKISYYFEYTLPLNLRCIQFLVWDLRRKLERSTYLKFKMHLNF
jgi:hypothetical protein